MSTNQDDKNKVVTTPKFRMSFPHLFKPHSGFKNQEPVYSVQMLFPKKDDKLLQELKKAAFEAGVKKWGPDQTKWPQFKHKTFKDGDEKKNLQGYEGMFVVEARSKFRPGVVDGNLQEVLDPAQAYAGRWARATVTCFAYSNMGNAGISFGLQNVQLLENDAAFSGRKNAKDDFGVVEGFDNDGSTSGLSSDASTYDF